MPSQDIIKMANELNNQAEMANSYYSIMMQYTVSQKEYPDEMNISPSFYRIVYGALQEACFMEVSKLYDSSSESVSIGSLLKSCKENIQLFPENRCIEICETNGKTYKAVFPYRHKLKPVEEKILCNDSDIKNRIKSEKETYSLFGIESIDAELTFAESLELYAKCFNSLSKKIKNLRVQRNKIYAHNDVTDCNIANEHPILYSDIKEMIEFALDVTERIYGVLTGNRRVTICSKVEDWTNTLKFVRLGLKSFHENNIEE